MTTIKKHYNNLWKSLPEDHMITLERFYDIKIIEFTDQAVAQIVSSTNSQLANKKIFDLIISVITNDYQLLGLSFLMERLANGVVMSDSPYIESFRNG